MVRLLIDADKESIKSLNEKLCHKSQKSAYKIYLSLFPSAFTIVVFAIFLEQIVNDKFDETALSMMLD